MAPCDHLRRRMSQALRFSQQDSDSMTSQQIENFREKLRLATKQLLEALQSDYKLMLREHSRDGKIGSGDTISKTMKNISARYVELYTQILNHLVALDPKFTNELESEVQELAQSAQVIFKVEAIKLFKESTVMAKKPNHFDRLLPDLESNMSVDFANFQNALNTAVLQIKYKTTVPPLAKVLWAIELMMLLIAAGVAGMWYKDPTGNYEPIIVGLSLVIPLVGVAIKLSSKNET